MHILFVEDEAKIANFVRAGLKEQGFVVDYCDNGDEGYTRALDNVYDVIVLDIMVPGKDGLSILKNLRRKGQNVPVILLTARNELDDRIEGLNLGADDYLAKPFFVEELVARIHAVVRRSAGDRQSAGSPMKPHLGSRLEQTQKHQLPYWSSVQMVTCCIVPTNGQPIWIPKTFGHHAPKRRRFHHPNPIDK